MARAIRLVMFDCDGVLFHSERANVEFYNAILRAMGEPILNAELERFCTYASARQLFEACFPGDATRFERALAIAYEISYEPFYAYMVPVAGLFETLEHLAGTYALAMATNRSRTAAELVPRFGLDRHIQFVSAVGPGIRPKPEPDILVRCLEHFGVAAEEAVYVGDAETDREAARRAGTHFVGFGDRILAGPRVDSFAEIPTAVPGHRT